MRFTALACDYDGTVATDGVIADDTAEALSRVVQSGRKLLLVTGRELPDLLRVCPRISLFHWVVAENGALLYQPATGSEEPLAPPPSAEFVATLQRRGVEPCTTGRVIVSTCQPHEKVVLETIRDLGLELQVIFNKGAVMVLPSGTNKATGLASALAKPSGTVPIFPRAPSAADGRGEEGTDRRLVGTVPFSGTVLSLTNTVAVGDAENDHALLESCAVGVAVANAVPLLKAHADWVADAPNGEGVRQLIDRLLANDLSDLPPKLRQKPAAQSTSGFRPLSSH